MITLELTQSELNFVECESQKQGITIQEYFKNMLYELMPKAKHEKPLNPMIARAMANENPSVLGNGLDIQRRLR